MTNVTPLANKRQYLQEMLDDIKAVVYKYEGRAGVMETVGVLEQAKLDIIEAAKGQL